VVVFFSILIVIYCAMITLIIVGWSKKQKTPPAAPDRKLPYISVVIPVRNEAKNILSLLEDLNNQDYPVHLFEVIVVDDQSTDGTYELVCSKLNDYSFKLTQLKLPSFPLSVSTKKLAIKMGVEAANGDYILTTDGDCKVKNGWVSSYGRFLQSRRFSFVAGMVTFHQEKTFFDQLQTAEFAVLVGVGASSIQWRKPIMCNAANMAFSKNAFLQIEGYKDVEHIISGDDGFLMEKLAAIDKNGIGLNTNKNAIVLTRPQSSLKAFYHQRKRWASKWKLHNNTATISVAIILFIFHFTLLLTMTFSLLGYYPIGVFLFQFLLKAIFDFAFLRIMLNYLDKRLNFAIFLTIEAIYSIYTVFFGITANFGGFKWKDRAYSMKSDALIDIKETTI
jgi:poly-beta-1,6-N-acetyl-D-glucosamine synthase